MFFINLCVLSSHPNLMLEKLAYNTTIKNVKKENRFWEIAYLQSSCSRCPESNWGSDYLCSECKKNAYTTNIGKCDVCGRGTSCGAYKLCNSCACKQKQCQVCKRIL